jgi:hypothetical protein
MRKQNWVMITAGLLLAGRALTGSLDPTNAPGPTMHTLEEIYQKLQSLDPDTQQTLSEISPLLSAGYYVATNLTQVDVDLTPSNIRTNVTIFGIAGTLSTNTGSAYPAVVPKTGQTTSYQAGDNGSYQRGVAWPNPRFTIQADTNCVLDNLTGLIWARNANLGGAMTWSGAITYCEALNYGGQTDWRLPSILELQSLVDYGQINPSLPTGYPFIGVQNYDYWSGTSLANNISYAWGVTMVNGGASGCYKTLGSYYVWPVRGGQ